VKLSGHVEKHSRKSWTLVVELPPDPKTGKRRRMKKAVEAPNKKEAERLLRLWLTDLERTQTLPSRITLAEWLDRWMRDRVVPRCAPKTVVGYRNCLAHILPALGDKELQELSAGEIQSWLSHLREAGKIGARTQEYAFAVLRKALNDAVKSGELAFNPCLRCDPPRPSRPLTAAIPPEELEHLLANAPKEFGRLMATAAFTGLRLGELLGLCWREVNLQEGWLQVVQAVQVVEGRYLVRPPKQHSVRRISLPPSLVSLLHEHRREQTARRLKAGPEWHDLDLVFPRPDGYYLHPSTVYHQFRRLCLEILGKPYRFHDLRHTHATLLMLEDTHPRVVQARLGHSQISVTMDLYSHVLPQQDREAAETLENLVNKKR